MLRVALLLPLPAERWSAPLPPDPTLRRRRVDALELREEEEDAASATAATAAAEPPPIMMREAMRGLEERGGGADDDSCDARADDQMASAREAVAGERRGTSRSRMRSP